MKLSLDHHVQSSCPIAIFGFIKGVYSVSGLLRKALDVIPKSKWKSTPVSLRATAGLRLLPENVAHNIIKEVIIIVA